MKKYPKCNFTLCLKVIFSCVKDTTCSNIASISDRLNLQIIKLSIATMSTDISVASFINAWLPYIYLYQITHSQGIKQPWYTIINQWFIHDKGGGYILIFVFA